MSELAEIAGRLWTASVALGYNGAPVTDYAVIADDAGRAAAVWIESTSPSSLYYRYSLDAGRTWGNGFSYAPDAEKVSSLSADRDDLGNLFLAFTAERFEKATVRILRTDEPGGLLSGEYVVSKGSGFAREPDIAVSGDAVHVVWSDYDKGRMNVWYRMSGNGGTKWSNAGRLVSSPDSSLSPSVVADGKSVFVAWLEKGNSGTKLLFKRSPNGGKSWKKAVELASSTGRIDEPELMADGSRVWLFYKRVEGARVAVKVKLSADGGQSWQGPYRVGGQETGSVITFGVTGSGGGAAAAVETAGGVLLTSTVDGIDWEEPYRVDDGERSPTGVQLSSGAGRLLLAWLEPRRGITDIFVRTGD